MNRKDFLKALAKDTCKISAAGKYKIGNKIYEFDVSNKIKFYEPDFDFFKIKNTFITHEKTKIEVFNETTVDGIFSMSQGKSVKDNLGVLNFASAFNPGGGFINGSMAQEESLAYCSDLYNQLTKGPGYLLYKTNKESDSPFYTDAMNIGQVTFFRNAKFDIVENHFRCNVLTCPAVNMKKIANHKEISIEDAKLVMKNRMRKVLYLFAYSGCDEIILGAWGCGVFGNKPEDIAKCWYELLIEENIKQYFTSIRFSILDKDGSIVEIFEKFFHKKR